MKTVLFYIISIFSLLCAIFVVTTRHLFRAALALIGVLTGIAGMYLLIDAQFLSAVQITVYIGGIVVLVVYVVMLVSDVTQKGFADTPPWRKAVGGILAAMLFVLLLIASAPLALIKELAARSATVTEIGRALISPEKGGFVLAFELISILLIAAVIGALTIAFPGDFTDKEKEEKEIEEVKK
ncbi:MAG: NADH-quinone oxidoreductase subunit J family protein [Verrucomicrobiia bacterium]